MICRPRIQRAAQLEARGDAHSARRWLCGRDRVGHHPYPRELEEVIELAGRRVTLRPIRGEDEVQHDEFLARVDPNDLRFRFGREMGGVPRSELARMTEIDYEREMAFIATVPRAEGGWETLGEVRALADPYGARSEFAIVVRTDLQRMGLGRVLLEKLIGYCRARDVQLLYGLVAPSNTGMLGLARELGFEVEHVPGGRTVVVSLDLQRGTETSLGHTVVHREQLEGDALRAS